MRHAICIGSCLFALYKEKDFDDAYNTLTQAQDSSLAVTLTTLRSIVLSTLAADLGPPDCTPPLAVLQARFKEMRTSTSSSSACACASKPSQPSPSVKRVQVSPSNEKSSTSGVQEKDERKLTPTSKAALKKARVRQVNYDKWDKWAAEQSDSEAQTDQSEQFQ